MPTSNDGALPTKDTAPSSPEQEHQAPTLPGGICQDAFFLSSFQHQRFCNFHLTTESFCQSFPALPSASSTCNFLSSPQRPRRADHPFLPCSRLSSVLSTEETSFCKAFPLVMFSRLPNDFFPFLPTDLTLGRGDPNEAMPKTSCADPHHSSMHASQPTASVSFFFLFRSLRGLLGWVFCKTNSCSSL